MVAAPSESQLWSTNLSTEVSSLPVELAETNCTEQAASSMLPNAAVGTMRLLCNTKRQLLTATLAADVSPTKGRLDMPEHSNSFSALLVVMLVLLTRLRTFSRVLAPTPAV